MQGISKVIGGFLGFLLAGPAGGVLGILIGHFFDQHSEALKQQYRFQRQGFSPVLDDEFLSAVFMTMGYLAKIDGIVSKQSIQNAYRVMEQFQLNHFERLEAIQLFEQGKNLQVDLQKVLRRFVLANYYNTNLLKQFLEIQLQASAVDGILSDQKKRALEHIARLLTMQTFTVDGANPFIEMVYKRHQEYKKYQNKQHGSWETNKSSTLEKAYATLGITQNASQTEMKQAYRRLINQYHPDKFVSKNLSTSELEKNKTKLHQVQTAYAKICEARGFKK